MPPASSSTPHASLRHHPLGLPVVLLGSWKLRHAEPLTAADYVIHAIEAADAVVGKVSAHIDLRGTRIEVARWQNDQFMHHPQPQQRDCENLDTEAIPLAFAWLSETHITLSHLITRIDPHRALLVEPVVAIDQSGTLTSLLPTLRTAFQANHLALNNWECRYAYSDAAFIEHFDIDTLHDARTLGEAWYALADTGALLPFTTQCGDEFQWWDHDATACRVIPTGFAVAQHWSRKRKLTWDEPLAQLSDSRHPNQSTEIMLGGSVMEAIATATGLPVQTGERYRRFAFVTECESAETGNIFSVVFETYSPHRRDQSNSTGQTTRGEVRFIKTRGNIVAEHIDTDLQCIKQHIALFLQKNAITMLPAISPITFLGNAGSSLAA